MTIEFRAVEATCRCFLSDAWLLKSQFLHDSLAKLVSIKMPDTDCLRAKVAEGATNSGVCPSVAMPCPLY